MIFTAILSASDLTLSWTDNSDNEDGFKVERSNDGVSFSEIGSVDSNTTSYTDQGLPTNETFWYRVRAFNSVGNSGYTNVATGSTESANTAPMISSLGDLTVEYGEQPSPLSFSVADAESLSEELIVTYSSSNESVLPWSAISIAGTGSERSISLSPNAGVSGSSVVSVTVSDGEASATESFLFTVNERLNSPPSISSLADQTIFADQSLGPILVSVADAETETSDLILSVTSTNQALVLNADLQVIYSEGSYLLSATPISQAYGMTQITVSASDGELTSTMSFNLNVVPIDDAPVISAISNRSIMEDSGTHIVAFDVNDLDTDFSQLTLGATSSNDSLIRNSSLSFSGSGTSRAVQFSVEANQFGSSSITINLSDGTSIVSREFTVVVSPVNDAPHISSISDASLQEGDQYGPVSFSIDDVDTPIGSLQVSAVSSNPTLLPTNNIALGGSGSSRTISASFASGQYGTATVTVSVSDGELSVNSSFELSVVAVPLGISISSPIDGATVPYDQLVTIESLTTHPDRVERVEYFLEGISIGESTAVPFSIETLLLVEGALQLHAVAHSKDGAVSSSSPVYIHVVNENGDSDPEPVQYQAFFAEDIGNVSKSGDAQYDESADAFLIRASGMDIGSSQDSFRFVSLKVVGDFTIQTRLYDFDSRNGGSKAGLMVRSTNESNADNVSLLVNGSGDLILQQRSASGASTTSETFASAGGSPQYMSLDKVGSLIKAYVSANGQSWDLVGQRTVQMGETTLVGMALAAHSKNRIAGAIFDSVLFDGELVPAGDEGGGTGGETITDNLFVSNSITAADIGAIAKPGSYSYDGATDAYLLKAPAASTLSSGDQACFAYIEVSGDVEIVARLNRIKRSNNTSEAGVMLRQSMDSGAPQASVLVRPDYGVTFRSRVDQDASAGFQSSSINNPVPLYLKIQRIGNMVTSFYSIDGIAWVSLGSETLTLDEIVYIGVTNSAETSRHQSTSTFDKVVVRPLE